MLLNVVKKAADAEVMYSCCSGHNFYISDSRPNCAVFGKSRQAVRHVKTDEVYYIIPFPEGMNKSASAEAWVSLIRSPADYRHFIWPADIVEMDSGQDSPRYALVFPMRVLPVYESMGSLLLDDLNSGWDKPWVKKIVSRLLTAWKSYYASGYVYHEFSHSSIFFRRENYSVMFDFNLSIQRAQGLYGECEVRPGGVSPDYADPYRYAGERASVTDLASDFYSCAVILFKLLIGRLPYQGRIMEHEPNSSEQEHKGWISLYHKNTYFIFDESDDSNRIGGDTGFAKDEVFVERWNSLPEVARDMFRRIFRHSNAMRTAQELCFYPPGEWESALFGGAEDAPVQSGSGEPAYI